MQDFAFSSTTQLFVFIHCKVRKWRFDEMLQNIALKSTLERSRNITISGQKQCQCQCLFFCPPRRPSVASSGTAPSWRSPTASTQSWTATASWFWRRGGWSSSTDRGGCWKTKDPGSGSLRSRRSSCEEWGKDMPRESEKTIVACSDVH